MNKDLYVSSPLLPELDDFIPYLREIWDNKRLTNLGPFHQALEQALADYLNVEHLSLFNNGTTALMAALQALAIDGEVITTPYTFAATAHALVWNRLTPVFVDIDPQTFNLDPAAIEAAITPHTRAILPVHCYGVPCDVAAIGEIARRYGLRVIYDAAHAFAVQDEQGSVLRHGDMSILSLHATKVFNTFEGGAIISPTLETKRLVDQLRNFGFVDETTVVTCGINGKMNEISAAFGLVQLTHIDAALQRRATLDAIYRKRLASVPGITLCREADNHAYFPILINDAYPLSRDQLYDVFRQQQIFTRRYFFPLITDMAAYRQHQQVFVHALPVATHVAQRVICLPLHPDLSQSDVERVLAVICEASSATHCYHASPLTVFDSKRLQP